MNPEPTDPLLSWDPLREAWHRSPPSIADRPDPTRGLRRLWGAEARRLRWITLGDWCLALTMAGILSMMALRVADPAGRCLLGLAALGCLAQPAWSLQRRRALWRATADSPRTYWTLRAERARQSIRWSRMGAWWFGSGLLLGACIRWILPAGSLPFLERSPTPRPWVEWLTLGLVLSGFLALQVGRLRRLGRELQDCTSIISSLGPPDGDEAGPARRGETTPEESPEDPTE